VIQETPVAPPAQPTQPPAPGDLDQMMKSAQILLFEDMVFDPSEYRYVQRTLDAMGLRYKDDVAPSVGLKTISSLAHLLANPGIL